MDPAPAPRAALERAALGVLLLGALFLAIHDVAVLAFPYDLIYGEGYLLRDASLIRQGRSPYTPLAPPPAVVANYPPVYPALVALVSVPLRLGLLPARLVSVLATAAGAAILARIARRVVRAGTGPGADTLAGGVAAAAAAALFAPLLFLADLTVYYWSPYARVDMLSLALELAALDAYHEVLSENSAASRPRRGALRRGHALALLAIFTRPTAVAAPAALVLFLALARRRAEALRAAVAFAGSALALALLLSAATRGEFLRHTLTYNANAFRWGDLHRLLLDFATVHAPLLLGAAGWFALGPRAPSDRLLSLFALLSFGLALLVGKVGSSANYFLQAVAGAALLFGAAIARSEGPARRILLAAAAAGPLLATAVPWVRACELRLNPFPAMGRTPGADDRRAGDEVARAVAATPGEVLVEDAGFAVRAGKTVWAHPLVLDYLEREGRYDPAPLGEMIRRREFSLIVVSYGFFSPSLEAAIGEAYRPERAIEIPGRFRYVLLRPAPG